MHYPYFRFETPGVANFTETSEYFAEPFYNPSIKFLEQPLKAGLAELDYISSWFFLNNKCKNYLVVTRESAKKGNNLNNMLYVINGMVLTIKL